MYLAQLWRYPVKSMAGERLEEAMLTATGVPGDRDLLVVDAHGRVVTARSRPRLLSHRATLTTAGDVLVDGRPWDDARVAEQVRAAAGPQARLVRADRHERFDVLPLMVTTDGALADLAIDVRRLRPNLVIGGVAGLAERGWQGRVLRVGDALLRLADLRQRCIMTTWDPDTQQQDVGVLTDIRLRYQGLFGLNAEVSAGGIVRRGDEAEIVA